MCYKPSIKFSGISYVLLFVAGFYANFFVLEKLVVPSDPEITVSNFVEFRSLFRQGILGFVVMLLFDISLVGSLYFVTHHVNKKVTIFASLLRLSHALVFTVALMSLFSIYQNTHPSLIMDEKQLQELVITALANFNATWNIGLLLFGMHLLVLGYLCLKSHRIANGIGGILLLAASGYLLDGLAKLFLESYKNYKETFEIMVLICGVLGELTFTFWLLFQGFWGDRFNRKYNWSGGTTEN